VIFAFPNIMKDWAGILTVVAVLALIALGLVFKIGLALPPRFEDMTFNGDVPEATNVTLHIGFSNETGRELSVYAVLDGAVSFGGSLIRDQHFGSTGIGMHVEPGEHILQSIIAGRPAITNTLRFSTAPGKTNYIGIGILPDSRTKYRFKAIQSMSPSGLM
jgi:hypothetical protein